jgi:hypothetical protein
VARALIVGCGCRGRELGAELRAREWRVRGTSRGADGVAAIERAGLEGAVADPDRPGTVLDQIGNVTVVIWLLGSARGENELIAAIHGPRLERLLEKLVDSPVRAFVYEAVGDLPSGLLAGGLAAVERASHTWRIPVAALERERTGPGWAGEAARSVIELAAAR